MRSLRIGNEARRRSISAEKYAWRIQEVEEKAEEVAAVEEEEEEM